MESPHEIPSQKRHKKKVYDGRPIAILRVIHGLTQQQLADATGMKKSKIGKIERGEWAPDEDQLVQLAHALRVPRSVLEHLRDVVSWVERAGEQSSLWSAPISTGGSQPEIIGEPDSPDPKLVRQQARQLKDDRIVSRAQESLSEVLWRAFQGPHDPPG